MEYNPEAVWLECQNQSSIHGGADWALLTNTKTSVSRYISKVHVCSQPVCIVIHVFTAVALLISLGNISSAFTVLLNGVRDLPIRALGYVVCYDNLMEGIFSWATDHNSGLKHSINMSEETLQSSLCYSVTVCRFQPHLWLLQCAHLSNKISVSPK